MFAGRDPVSGQAVAIKQVRAPSAVSARRFLREVEALRRLAHPGIAPLLEAGEAFGALFLVLPLVPGESLARRLQRGPLPEREAAGIALQVARALAHAHAQGVLHRDVKPDNVRLRPDGAAVLIDFGLTTAVELDDRSRLSQTGQLIGTPGFWAPEQASGDLARIGAATDVYGLGATLYAALTGSPPFVVESLSDLGRLLEEDPAPPSQRVDVDPALDELVLRTLARHPVRRPASAAALAEALEAWLERGPRVRAAPGRPRALAAAGLLVAGLLVAAIFGRLREVEARDPAPGEPHGVAPGPGAPPVPLPPAPRTSSRSADPRPEAPLDPSVLEARSAIDAGDFARAEALLAASRSDDIAARFQRSRLRYRLADFAGAVAEGEEVVERAPDVPRYLTSLAAALATCDRLDAAHAAATRALTLDPRFAEAWRNRAHISLARGDPRGAIRDATVAICLQPARDSTWCDRSEARAELGDLEGARADAARAVGLDPDAWRGHERLAAALQRLGRWAEALAAAEAAVARRTNGPTLRARGLARLATASPEAALADLQAYHAAPDGGPDAESLLGLGACHGALGATDDAAAAFEGALRLAPSSAAAHAGLACARLDQGDLARAEESAARALRLHPKSHAARLVVARLARLRGDVVLASALVDELLGEGGASADARIERACLRAAAGDHAGALADLDLAEAAGLLPANRRLVERVRASLPPSR